MKELYNVQDFKLAAQKRLPRGLFEFLDRGTEDEAALANNRNGFSRIKFLPRTLIDVSARTTETELFGKKLSAPIAIAPTGAAGLLWYQGEVELARAAAKANIPFTLATGSLTAIETVADVSTGPLWFQLYMWPDKNLSMELVERVGKAGFDALVVTVDVPVPSNREYNFKNGFTLPFRLTRRNVPDVMLHPGWALRVIARYALTTGLPRYENLPASYRTRFTSAPMGRAMPKSDSVSWDDLKELRKQWKGRLLVKGILHPDDADKAIAAGADGIIVSNHGGRMLDHAIAPIDALTPIVDKVDGRVPVLIDSGFTRGSDIVKALALGAATVLVGRAPLYGVAVGGRAGAERVIALLSDETKRVMGLIGAPRIEDLGRHNLVFQT